MLKAYQNAGVHHLLTNAESGLFFEPGLGKTITFLTYFKLLQDITSTPDYKPRALVIAPIHACNLVWPKEIKKWAHTKHLTCAVLRDENKAQAFNDDVDIHIIDFHQGNLSWLVNMIANAGKSPWAVLCVDESTKFKNYESNRFKALSAMLHLFARRHILTGTPSPNGLIDLFAQMFIMDRGKTLGELPSHYTGKYFQYNRDFRKHMLIEGMESIIQKKISPSVLTMKGIDHLDLPDLHYNYIEVQLPPDARKVYNLMQSQFFLELGKTPEGENVDIEASTAGHKYSLCWQIASGSMYVPEPKHDKDGVIIEETVIDCSEIEANYPIQDHHYILGNYRPHFEIHTAKLDAMTDLIDSLGGKPLLLAYMFNHEQRAILERLESMGLDYKTDGGYISGDIGIIGSAIPQCVAHDALASWSERRLKVLMCQPASVSHGLNLQDGGNDILWFSQTDNFEEYEQFNKRLHRQGVVGGVRVHHLYARGTVDEIKVQRMNRKDAAQESLKDALINYRARTQNGQ